LFVFGITEIIKMGEIPRFPVKPFFTTSVRG